MADKDSTINTGGNNSELIKRTAAGLARATAGRARVIDSKKKYKRAKARKEKINDDE